MDRSEQQKILATVLSPEGSLGQLALGAVGLRAWRKMRAADASAKNKEHKTDVNKK